MEYQSASEQETADIAAKLADTLVAPCVVALNGTLGAGKTAFARAFIRHLIGANITVPSPTFTLLQTYDCAKGLIYHFDLYRLESPDEVYELDWETACYNGIVLVEWPERLGLLLPLQRHDVTLTAEPTGNRRITIDATDV